MDDISKSVAPAGRHTMTMFVRRIFCRPCRGFLARYPPFPTTCVVGYRLAPLRGLFLLAKWGLRRAAHRNERLNKYHRGGHGGGHLSVRKCPANCVEIPS